jgi:hypothetical protein
MVPKVLISFIYVQVLEIDGDNIRFAFLRKGDFFIDEPEQIERCENNQITIDDG